MSRRLLTSLLTAALLATSAACSVPHERSELPVTKRAATAQDVERIFERYAEVRRAAIKLLDPKPLSIVESGAMLDIDSGSFRVAQTRTDGAAASGLGEVEQVITPTFSAYPLWFVALVRDRESSVKRVQVFERQSAIDPWLLVQSPETLWDVTLPELRGSATSAALPVEPDNGVGMSLSPAQAAEAYAATLLDPSAAQAAKVEQDGFIKQMRETAATNGSLENVDFSQQWSAEEVRFALRTADGGAIVWVDLVRTDTYEVSNGRRVTWPEGTPQAAFMPEGITENGSLQYYHQVLLYIPGGAGGKARALGQYGGPVRGDGA